MSLRNLGPLVSALALILVSSRAAGARASPAARLEFEYGSLWETNTYEFQGAAAERAVHFRLERGNYTAAYGVRGTFGIAIVTPRLALFPRFTIGYAQSSEQSMLVVGELSTYTLRFRHHYWFSDLGLEFQFFDRVFLTEFGLGLSEGYATYRLPQFSNTEYSTDPNDGFLVHLGVGLRAPLHTPVTFGVKAGVDTLPWLGEQTRWTATLFVEIDPLYGERSK